MSAPISELYLEQVGGPQLAEPTIAINSALLIGRGTDSRLTLADVSISRRHAQIVPGEQSLLICDLGSRSGTFLNDVRLSENLPVPLQEHDRVRVGVWRFRIRSKALLVQRTQSAMGNTSVSGLTQMAAPMLAAEARLEVLVEFVGACTDKASLDELFAVLLGFCKRAVNAQRVAIFSAHSAQAVCYFPDNFRAAPLSDAFAASARGGVVVVELARSGATNESAAVAALRVDGEALGFVQVEFVRAKPLDEHLEALHALVRLAGLAAASIERKDAEQRVQRLHQDIETAHRVQKAILPPAIGKVSGLCYALHVHPGRVIAGDLVDIFSLDEHRSALLLGDVSGQGFGAAVQMASAQAYLHAELRETFDPAIATARCNAYLMRIGGGRFVTAFIAVFDRRSNSLSVVDAGHGHAALLVTDASGNSLKPLNLLGSVPLGIDAHAQFQAEVVPLSAGQRLLVYSDGVAEHRDADGRHFSEVMARTLSHSQSVESDIQIVLDALKLHGGSLPDDDATILSVAMH